jgi:hypothetical protein
MFVYFELVYTSSLLLTSLRVNLLEFSSARLTRLYPLFRYLSPDPTLD